MKKEHSNCECSFFVMLVWLFKTKVFWSITFPFHQNCLLKGNQICDSES